MFPEQKADLVLEELLERLRPRLQRTFARHRIPPLVAKRMLCELLVAMVLRWPEIEDPARWMTVMLCQRCQVYRRRQQELATVARASSRTGRQDAPSSLPDRSAGADGEVASGTGGRGDGEASGASRELVAGDLLPAARASHGVPEPLPVAHFGPPAACRRRGLRERAIATLRCGLGMAGHGEGTGPHAVARLLEGLERGPQARGRAIRIARHRP